MDGLEPIKWSQLSSEDRGRIRQQMVKDLIPVVMAKFPHESGRICYEVAISMADKAIKAERAKENSDGKANHSNA